MHRFSSEHEPAASTSRLVSERQCADLEVKEDSVEAEAVEAGEPPATSKIECNGSLRDFALTLWGSSDGYP